jgi:predicted dehydrogenase
MRIALLGTGSWGARYARTIRDMPGLRLTALASRRPESAALAPEARLFADWRDAVSSADVTAVIVAAPPYLHAEMGLAALAAGKPVLIEKPLTMSLDEAQALQQKARQCRTLAMVGHTQLFNAAFRGLKQHLPQIGALKRITIKTGNWGPVRPGVRALWDYAPHDIAMCLDLFQRPPDKIAAVLLTREAMGEGHAESYEVRLSFGAIDAVITTGNAVRPKCRRLEIEGAAGMLVFDDLAAHKLFSSDKGGTALPYAAELPLTTQVREFAEAAAAGRTEDGSLAMGCTVVDIIARCEALLAPHV